MAGGRVGAGGAVRVPRGGVRGLPHRAATSRRRRRYRRLHGPPADSQPRLRAAARHPRVRPILRQRVRALGARRELLRVGLG